MQNPFSPFHSRNKEMQLQKAQMLVPDKKTFYKACLRNQFCMPAYKSSLCCIKYMERIRSGKYWCPKTQDVNPVYVADPPLKTDIVAHLLAFAKDKNLNLGITEKRQPDKQWALLVLHKLQPNHAYFRKDYVRKTVKEKIMINNDDGFLDNLPPGPLKKKFGMIFKENEEVMLKRKMLLAEKRLAKNKKHLQKLQRQQDSDDEAEEVSSSSDEDGALRHHQYQQPQRHQNLDEEVNDKDDESGGDDRLSTQLSGQLHLSPVKENQNLQQNKSLHSMHKSNHTMKYSQTTSTKKFKSDSNQFNDINQNNHKSKSNSNSKIHTKGESQIGNGSIRGFKLPTPPDKFISTSVGKTTSSNLGSSFENVTKESINSNLNSNLNNELILGLDANRNHSQNSNLNNPQSSHTDEKMND